MSSLSGRSAIVVNCYEQTDQEFAMAVLENDQELLEFVHNNYVNTLKTREFCAALEEHLDARKTHQSHIHDVLAEPDFEGPLLVHEFFHDLECVYRKHLSMREALQSFHNSIDLELRRIDLWKKASAVFSTAEATVAAVAAAANANTKNLAAVGAAAAASVLLDALGRWIHSLLKKRERAVEKQKAIISVMIMVAKIAMKSLSDIHVSARRLQFQTEAMSETLADEDDVRKKLVELEKSFRELQGKANDYSRDMRWAKEAVLQSFITHSDNGN